MEINMINNAIDALNICSENVSILEHLSFISPHLTPIFLYNNIVV